MSTYFPKGVDILQRKWFVVDATGIPVGRLSTVVADVLSGKNKPTWTPFLDTGDHVVVINASKAVFTGRKATQKYYRRTTTQPGSMVEVRADVMKDAFPGRIIESAVKGMLPKGPLGRAMYRKLKVYEGPEHHQEAQQPEFMTIKL
ncbi:MAG TPA: 50S ribosomal protein L13 [Holophaga sp.]|nr:50S ribosomal protein L13 [Holophaga sp.]HPS67018.1 50S ribosomal protein L13 [Holophaga sp.]